MDPLLIIHAAATFFLGGLIWTIQAVHYPLFALVGRDQFAQYERQHQARITRVVAPPMVVELVTALLLLVWTPDAVPYWALIVGAALVVWIWISTAAEAVPRHRELELGFNDEAHRGLMQANWRRTFLWTVRCGLVLWMLATTGVRT